MDFQQTVKMVMEHDSDESGAEKAMSFDVTQQCFATPRGQRCTRAKCCT